MPAPTDPPLPLEGRALLGRLGRDYLRADWLRMALSMGCAVGVAALTSFLAWILSPAISRIFEQHRADSLVLIVAAIAGAGLCRGLAQIGQASLVNAVGHGVVGKIQRQLFANLVHGDLARLRERHSGAYVSSVLYDANLVREALTSGVVNYTQNLLQVFGALVVMASQDGPLTLVVLVFAPVSQAVMRRFSRRTRTAADGAMSETSALSTAVMESLDGIKIVKIDNREAFEEARVAAVVERRQSHVIRGANARAAAAPATETLMTLVTAAVIAYAGWLSLGGHMTLGRLTAFLFSLGVASQSLRQVANLQTVFAEGLTAARRLFLALDVRREIGDAPGASPLRLTQGTLELQAVSFAYASGEPALRDVNLRVGRGETAALVGPSGGGKSTLLNLIPRFYDVCAGRVTLDGQDIRSVSLRSLRDAIALVTQDPFLFDDTVRANIAYARPEAPFEAVIAAARAADAHDFIERLAEGYDTPVGEGGTRLSGGQKQRIAIARAFLKDAPILLMDEATSALDAESERKVQAALLRLMAGRTTLMIAHRLATVRHADQIYVIDKGEVVEAGAHAGLLKRGGLYARLARAQTLDPAPETVFDAVSASSADPAATPASRADRG